MKMVDIGDKPTTERIAIARGEIKLKPSTIIAVQEGKIKKGEVLTAAQFAGIQAVKNTPSIVPLCHPIPVIYSTIDLEIDESGSKIIAVCEVKADYKTGVEMEALTGVTAALLTIWDMTKYLEKDENGQYPDTKVNNIEVIEKIKG